MKKGNTKKNFKKFSSVNTHKRRDKEKRRAELLRALESINVKHEGFSFRDSVDSGYRARTREKTENAVKRALGIYSGTRSGFGFEKSVNGLFSKSSFALRTKSSSTMKT